jgi:hypothetical protein
MQKIFSQLMHFLKRRQGIICNFALVLAFSFVSLNTLSYNVSAVYTPTLSASINQTELTVNGNQIINSTSKSTNLTLNLKVNTNNKTGYTTTISSETENTALINTNPGGTDKISSISDITSLNGFSANTWGYKLSNDTNYNPIPALSSPANLVQTTAKTNGDEVNSIDLGIKLGNNLESGNYKNKLIFSVVTNYYEPKAILTTGSNFQSKITPEYATRFNKLFDSLPLEVRDQIRGHEKNLEYILYIVADYMKSHPDWTPPQNTITAVLSVDILGLRKKIKSIKRSATPPALGINTHRMEDESSDLPIYFWVDEASESLKFYTESEKIYLNRDSNSIFSEFNVQNGFDLNYFDTSMVENMGSMFYETTRSMESIDLSNFDTRNVVDMSNMFSYDTLHNDNPGKAPKFKNLDLSMFNTEKLENASYMFYGLSNLEHLKFSNSNTPNLKNMDYMFCDLISLKELDISNLKTSNVKSMKRTFAYAAGLNSVDFSKMDTSKVEIFEKTFFASTINNSISTLNTSSAKVMDQMFHATSSLEDIDLSGFDVSKVKSLDDMFSQSKFKSLNISNWNAVSALSMNDMFKEAKIPNGINFGSYFNTSNVTSAKDMFNEATIDELNLSPMDVGKVENFHSAFYKSRIKRLDLSGWNTSSATDMAFMFSNMDELTELKLGSGFNTSNVTDMSCMFERIGKKLEELDLSLANFDTRKVKNINYIFTYYSFDTSKLRKIYVKQDFDLSSVTTVDTGSLFYNQKTLRGGNGSFKPDPSDADLIWLRIDRPGAPGYFTQK